MSDKTEERQRIFVDSYTTPGQPGFLNASRAAQQAYPDQTRMSAQVTGSRMLRNPMVKGEVAKMFADSGLSMQDRSRLLAEIARGESTFRTTTETLDKDGNVTHRQVTIHEPSHRDRLHAADLATKMDGTYQRQESVARVAEKEWQDLKRRALAELAESRKQHNRETERDVTATTESEPPDPEIPDNREANA